MIDVCENVNVTFLSPIDSVAPRRNDILTGLDSEGAKKAPVEKVA